MALEHAGKTILEMLWEQAVIQYGVLRELHQETEGANAETLAGMLQDGLINQEVATETAYALVTYFTQIGKLQGIAYAIAKLLNPAKPDVDSVKQQIRDQWEAAEEE